eukprot:CAMPEP_0178476850 /NCGR_PEP_ID=MMETSP0696-20121128/3835_1 /TAXON_ID=265572 /ORGANISM="Extubocellulus spinifer, Strain CCMP396" /LENGTH=245 /DNA_ID=CAMNT_0020104157 /DNA_START=222 /DNA_END=959 /DNA_ORIENTATION=+
MAELAMDSDGTLPKSRGQTPWAHFSRSIVPSDLLRELAESRPEALAFVACQAKGCDCCRCQLCVDESEAKARRTDGVPHYLTCDSCHTTKCYHCGGAEDYFFRCFKCYTSYWLPRLHLGNGKACMPCYWSSKPCTNPDCPNEAGVPTKRCGGCRRSRYCSKECQIAMWPEHKKTCMGVVDVATETKEEEIAELGGSETTSNATERSISEFDGSETSSVYLESEASDDLDVSEASSNADAGGCSVS